VPENGFLSAGKYTNAFFGFSLPLPKDVGLREQTLSLNRGKRDHFLLGFHSPNEGLTTFTITAREAPGGSEKEARKDATGPNSSKFKEVKIGGRSFWRSESPKRGKRNRRGASQIKPSSFLIEVAKWCTRNLVTESSQY